MKDAKRWLPGAIISIGLIAAILYFVDLRAMLDAMRNADYTRLTIAFAIGFAWMAIRSLVWWTLLLNRGMYRDIFWSLCAGYLLNAILPFRLGELGRAFLLSRKTEMKFSEILPTIIIERAVDLGFSAAIVEDNAPVCKHPIHVEEQQYNAPGLGAKARWNAPHFS